VLEKSNAPKPIAEASGVRTAARKNQTLWVIGHWAEPKDQRRHHPANFQLNEGRIWGKTKTEGVKVVYMREVILEWENGRCAKEYKSCGLAKRLWTKWLFRRGEPGGGLDQGKIGSVMPDGTAANSFKRNQKRRAKGLPTHADGEA